MGALKEMHLKLVGFFAVPCWRGSKLNHQGTAGLGPCVHLPGQPILGPSFDPQPIKTPSKAVPTFAAVVGQTLSAQSSLGVPARVEVAVKDPDFFDSARFGEWSMSLSLHVQSRKPRIRTTVLV